MNPCSESTGPKIVHRGKFFQVSIFLWIDFFPFLPVTFSKFKICQYTTKYVVATVLRKGKIITIDLILRLIMALRFTLGGFPQFTGISRVSRKAETNSCLLIASIIVGTLDVAFTSLKWNIVHKGQIKPKADWRAIDSPKKQTNKQTICFVCFFAFHSKQNKFIFWENLWLPNPAFCFIWPLELVTKSQLVEIQMKTPKFIKATTIL